MANLDIKARSIQQPAGQSLTPAPHAPSPAALKPDKLNKIDAIVNSAVGQKISGATILIRQYNQTVHFKSYGYSDLSNKSPLKTNNIFRIASMTKPITATLILMLYEQGLLTLHDPVSMYLPEFKQPQVLIPPNPGSFASPQLETSQTNITLFHLLTHTSGLTYHFSPNPYVPERYAQAKIAIGVDQSHFDNRANVLKISQQPLLSHPGKQWHYSMSMDVLGRVIETITGVSLREAFQHYIFSPLAMQDTDFYLTPKQCQRLVKPYYLQPHQPLREFPPQGFNTGRVKIEPNYPCQGPRQLYSGGAGLSSTASDYARFLQMLLNGGELDGVRLLQPDTVALLTQSHVTDLYSQHFPGQHFGLGVAVNQGETLSGKPGSKGSYAWGGLFYTQFWVDPKLQLVGVSLSQTYPPFKLGVLEAVQKVVYEALEP